MSEIYELLKCTSMFFFQMEKLETGGRSVSDDDDPPLSLDGSYMNHEDSAMFREPTEFEVSHVFSLLKNQYKFFFTETLLEVLHSIKNMK